MSTEYKKSSSKEPDGVVTEKKKDGSGVFASAANDQSARSDGKKEKEKNLAATTTATKVDVGAKGSVTGGAHIKDKDGTDGKKDEVDGKNDRDEGKKDGEEGKKDGDKGKKDGDEGKKDGEGGKKDGEEGRKELRKTILLHHGQRQNFALDLCQKQKDEQGATLISDLNYVRREDLPERPAKDFESDPSLSQIGLFSAERWGRALRKQDFTLAKVVSSPTLRCMQTAKAIILGYGKKDKEDPVKIAREFGFLEPAAKAPPLLSAKTLVDNGFPLDSTYTPLHPDCKFLEKEQTVKDCYSRNEKAMKYVLGTVKGGDIVVVGNDCTLEYASRTLVGRPPRGSAAVQQIAIRTPSLASIMVIQKGTDFELAKSPVPPFTICRRQYNPDLHMDIDYHVGLGMDGNRDGDEDDMCGCATN